jgi:hypothetical protein
MAAHSRHSPQDICRDNLETKEVTTKDYIVYKRLPNEKKKELSVQLEITFLNSGLNLDEGLAGRLLGKTTEIEEVVEKIKHRKSRKSRNNCLLGSHSGEEVESCRSVRNFDKKVFPATESTNDERACVRKVCFK